MNVGTAHSEVNPNTRVMNSRGIWLSYVLGIGLLHVVLLSIPFFSVPVVWTLTNIIHNMVRELRGLLGFPGHGEVISRHQLFFQEQSSKILSETIPFSVFPKMRAKLLNLHPSDCTFASRSCI